MNDSLSTFSLERKHSSEKTAILIFRKSNLSTQNFKKVNGGYLYSETVNMKGITFRFSMSLHGGNFERMLTINTDTLQITGNLSCFEILARIDNSSLPCSAVLHAEAVWFFLNIERNPDMVLHKPHYKKKKNRYKNEEYLIVHRLPESRSPIPIPPSVVWAMAHPYAGGRCSPR